MSITEFFSLFNTIIGIAVLLVAFDSLVLLSDLLFPWIPQQARSVLVKILPWYVVLLAVGGIAGPLTYEYFFSFPPCELCWYNRIFMWPALILSLFAVYEKQVAKLSKYILFFATIVTIIGVAQVLTQFGVTPSPVPCSASGGPSCSEIDVLIFNFLTIPMMAVITSASVIVNTLFWRRNQN